MPKPGYRTITVKEKLHKNLELGAKERFTTVPKFIEYLIANSKTKEAKA